MLLAKLKLKGLSCTHYSSNYAFAKVAERNLILRLKFILNKIRNKLKRNNINPKFWIFIGMPPQYFKNTANSNYIRKYLSISENIWMA